MPSELFRTTLGAICERQGGAIQTGPFGSQLHASDYIAAGTPVVMPADIVGGRVSTTSIARVGTEHVERLSQHQLRLNDVVFSRRGDVTRFALVTAREVGWLCGTGCLKVRVGTGDLALPEWISLALGAPEVKEWLVRHAVGATMPNLNTAILGALPLAVPPIERQREAVEMCFALDDRINLLRDTNDTLETIAKALFKSWFIDFDPVRAKADGLEPEGMDATTAALFPNEFQKSPLGLVPKDWHVDEVGRTVECVGGGTPSTKQTAYWAPAVHHWATPKDLSGLGSPVLLDTERRLSDAGLAKVSSGLLPPGTLLMSSRAPIGYLALAQVPLAVNQGFIAMKPGGALPPLFLYFWCQAHMDAIKQKANGSTFMEISKAAFRPIPLVVPPKEVVGRFVEVAGPLFGRIAEGDLHRAKLIELRDALLPRLVSDRVLTNGEDLQEEALASSERAMADAAL